MASHYIVHLILVYLEFDSKKKCCNLILLGNNVKNPVCNKNFFTALCLDWGAIILVNFGENP